MCGGFSFCGVDIADIGLEYAPEKADTYVYAPSVSNIHEEIFEGHDGGYSYGVYKEPKTFILKCFYEEKHIAKGLMVNVFNLFKPGKSGMLVFKRRPWCYYYATVTEKPDISEMYNYLNGVITITMKAYYPFAKGLPVNNHLFYNLKTDKYHSEIMQNTALLDTSYMMPATSFTSVTNPKDILLYNPGTERAKVNILISGNAGDGVLIKNNTTNQSCRYVAFTSSVGEIYTDGINGKTTATKNGDTQLAFLYHDYGFIDLEPAFPILRNLYVTCSGTTVTTINMLYQDDEEKDWYTNKYIFLGSNSSGKWVKITQCTDPHTLTLLQTGVNGSFKTSIVSMNEISIITTNNTSLSKLSFIYTPTYS